MFHVYILQSISKPDEFYTGFTESLADRLPHHNSGDSVHTAKHRPWRLILNLEFLERDKALAFEHYLKSGSGRAFAAKHFR